MIDSHCHLTDPRLFEQLEQVLTRATAAGVSRMITIGTELRDDVAAIELCRNRPNVRCAIGVHPNHCDEVDEADLPKLRELQADPSVVALGEMGLDYHHNFADHARQRRFFETQLAMAVEFNRPVVIHCREAVEDCLAIMRGFRVRAVFHCFTGTLPEAERILGAGYLLGFTGAVTFKKSDELRKVARFAPIDRLLIETDAPYLSPEPMRKQKINEPALIVHTAVAIAAARGVSVAQIDEITAKNCMKFFRWW
jgi:TatD DNase family protein